MKKIALLILFLPVFLFSQNEKYPIFKECENSDTSVLPKCFYQQLEKQFFKAFNSPIAKKNTTEIEVVNVLFSVNKLGEFKFNSVDSKNSELEKEIRRVFNTFSKITPAFNGNSAAEMEFLLPIIIPVLDSNKIEAPVLSKNILLKDLLVVVEKNKLADSISSEIKSQINIPFTHERYIDYDFAMHKADESHTASKPYLYNEVAQYYDIKAASDIFLKPTKTSWVGKKLWNEHLLHVQKKDYWITMDFLVDVQAGKDNSTQSYTYNNTRFLTINGGLGNTFSFSTTIYESQGRFANYINKFISSEALHRPNFSEGLVPGRGKAKGFGTDAFDYPVAEGYLSYTPNKFFQFQFGEGRNFIGDGYRSFILSDVSAPSTYLKMKVDLWKFQYTNTWLWSTEPSITSPSDENLHARKYIAMHYLSINISPKFNLGLFETAISSGERGFDAAFLNPIIFYRSVEFNRGEDAGNALVGLTGKYKLNKSIALYSQLVIDEFSVGNLNNLSDWRNKFATQLGAKYFHAFGIENLYLQAEYNYARPYTFAHKSPVLNYGNYSQPLGHLWGANFNETVLIARYKKNRISFNGKLVFGTKGFDNEDQLISYGGDIYQSYENRFRDTDNEIGQGATAKIAIADLNINYLLNPSNNLSLFGSILMRNFSSDTSILGYPNGATVWFSLGLKANFFNWYFDF